MKLKSLFLLLTITGLSLAAGAQGALYPASGSGNAGAVSVDWVLGSLSTDGGPADIALPVQFGNISASINNQRLLVQWTTETETNNDHFDIEVSGDGTHFKKIAAVASKAPGGNATSPLQYEYETGRTGMTLAMGLGLFLAAGLFVKCKRNYGYPLVVFLLAVAFTTGCNKKDLSLEPINPISYLRIGQIDKDGTKAYSKVIHVTQDQ
ncbi:hypothetical protein LQ567_25530 [Niabella pedocola]|uniref:F5/8 type C domain-containing protein n=1 Tax=Niabella pedocola TaxID=1752077 RepID=A0ABS8PYM5_9BACT|nr:hypothetical protein [Niabella pedocola]MCD2426172.1 hypothetical protein [Niabella pedocola]